MINLNTEKENFNLARTITLTVICVALAVSFELFVPNLAFWTTNGLQPHSISTTGYSSGIAQNDENGGLKAGSEYARAVYKLDNENASTISLHVSADTSKTKTVGIRIDASDSGWTRHTYMLANTRIESGNEREVIAKIKPYGNLKELVITAWGPDGSEVKISDVSLNKPIPMSFSFRLAALVLLAMLSIVAFRPNSILWRRKHTNSPWILGAFVVTMLVLMSSFFMWNDDGPNDTWGTSACGARDEYAMLARSIVNGGTLSLEQEPPAWLSSMDDLGDGTTRLENENNIYDPTARDAVRESVTKTLATDGKQATIDGYKLDVAYYDGKYFVYFGVIPCLMAYVPYYLITGNDLSNTNAIYPALLVFAIFSALIIDLLVRRKNPSASSASACLGFAAIAFSSCLVNTLAVPLFYNVPTVFALALLASGTYALMQAHYTDNNVCCGVLSIIGAFLLAFTLGCRPQIALGAIAVGIAFIIMSIIKAKKSNKTVDGVVPITCVVIPVILVISGLLWYNNARFGTPLDFGSNYNLTSNDMTLRGHSVARAVESVVWYMFGMPHLTSSYPYIDLSFVPELNCGIKTVAENFSGGLVFMAPFIIMIMASISDRKLGSLPRISSIIALIMIILISAFDSEGAGVLVRYLQDFGYLAGVSAAFILVSMSRTASGRELYETGKNKAIELGNKVTDASRVLVRPTTSEIAFALLIALSGIASLLVWIAFAENIVTANPLHPFTYEQLKTVFDMFGPHVL